MAKVIGIKNYRKVIEKLRKIGDVNVMPALERIGLKVHGDAKDLCPVDTGWLRMNIMLEKFYASQSVIVYNAVEYAPYVEFGTRRAKPHPFMKPAYNKNRDWADKFMQDYLKNYVKTIARS